MYIVFLAPETTDTAVLSQYEDICKKLENQKNNVVNGTFSTDISLHEDHAAHLTREIKKADALVVEASLTNFNLGRLITIAIQQHKPVLLLQKENNSMPVVIGSSRLIVVKSYKDDAAVEDALKDFIKVAKKQRLNYRFNLMLSRDIDGYLSEKAKHRGISKADYIRDLIIQEMEE